MRYPTQNKASYKNQLPISITDLCHFLVYFNSLIITLFYSKSECIKKDWIVNVWGYADKSLARPGRKQATATKHRIYSTHSSQSSVQFLTRCSNFCKPLKKIQNVVHPTRSPRQQWPPCWMKNGNLSIVFSVQGTGGNPTGPDLENRVGDQDIGSPGRPVSSGLQVPGELEHCHARTRPPWWPSCGVFPSKCPSIAPAEMSDTLCW